MIDYNGNAILADYMGNSIPESAKMVEIEGINLSKYKVYSITNIFHIHILPFILSSFLKNEFVMKL